MKLTSRDQWLCALLPAFLTLVIYERAIARPARIVRTTLEQQIRAQGPLHLRQESVHLAEAETKQVTEAIAEKKRQREANDSVALPEFDRNRALQQISQLCERNELSVVSSALDSGARLPPALQEAAVALASENSPSAPQIWKIEFRGSYSGMVGLLDAMRMAKPLMVPLSVGMQADTNERKPISWILNVWL